MKSLIENLLENAENTVAKHKADPIHTSVPEINRAIASAERLLEQNSLEACVLDRAQIALTYLNQFSSED